MKLLFVSGLYHPHQVGGAEKVARIVAESIRGAGHEAVVATTDPVPGVRQRELDGVRIHDVGLKNVYWPHDGAGGHRLLKPLWHVLNSYNPWMERAAGRILDQERPDVVNTHSLTGFSPSVWRASRARGIPIVHVLHDYSLLCPKTSMYRLGRNCRTQCADCRALSAPAKALSGLVDSVIGVSAFTLQRHLDAGYFPNARSAVIHNGLPEMDADAPDVRRPGPLRLGYVGQLNPAKGIRELVGAMRHWDADRCTLLVAGKGRPDFEDLLKRSAPGNVQFLGFIEPARVYREVDAIVIPSLWEEPLATIVLEAYAHGKPVIAARRGGLPEIVEHRATGYLYDPTQPGELLEIVSALVDDPLLAARMEPAIRRKAGRFRIERLQSDYLGVLTAAVRPGMRTA